MSNRQIKARIMDLMDDHLNRNFGVGTPDKESFKTLFRDSVIPFLENPQHYKIHQRSIVTGEKSVDYDFYQQSFSECLMDPLLAVKLEENHDKFGEDGFTTLIRLQSLNGLIKSRQITFT